MAERRTLGRKLQFQYLFDRLVPDKLEQAYQLLVPDHARPIRCPVTTFPQENSHDASRGHLYPSVFRSPEGGTLPVRLQPCWSTRRSTATSYRRNGYFKTKAIAALP